MANDHRKILDMLAEGKISVDDAERLLTALKDSTCCDDVVVESGESKNTDCCTDPKFIRIEIQDKKSNCNLRIPMQLVRAGANFVTLLPENARGKVQEALEKKGIPAKAFKASCCDDLIQALADTDVDIQDGCCSVRICTE